MVDGVRIRVGERLSEEGKNNIQPLYCNGRFPQGPPWWMIECISDTLLFLRYYCKAKKAHRGIGVTPVTDQKQPHELLRRYYYHGGT